MLKRSMWTRVVCLLSAGIFLASPEAFPLAPPSRIEGGDFERVFSRKAETPHEGPSRPLSAVTLRGQVFTLSVVKLDDGTRRVELNRQGRVKPKREPPDLFVYSFPVGRDPAAQGLRGVYIAEELRKKGLLRPLLDLFFKTFPNVRRTHPNLMDPVVLDLLAREYGFALEREIAPNAFFGRMINKSAIHFVDPEIQWLFYSSAPASMFYEFETVEFNLSSFQPLYLGESLVRKVRDEVSPLEEIHQAAEGIELQV